MQPAYPAADSRALVESLTRIEPATESEAPAPVAVEPVSPPPSQPAPAQDAWALRFFVAMDSLCQADSLTAVSQMGISIVDVATGTSLFQLNPRHRMRPASCQKLVTAITALCTLGPQYVLHTDVRAAAPVAGGVLQGDVWVCGGADPLLSQAEVDAMAASLRQLGIQRVQGRLCKDLSLKKDDKPLGWGWCWDDGDANPPLTPLAVDGRDRFPASWRRALQRQGIGHRGPDTLLAMPCPPQARTLARVEHNLSPLLAQMLKESDNFYAESLFMHLGALHSQRGSTRERAAAVVDSLAQASGIDASALCVADGSGLSLYNYLTPQFLTSLLTMAHARAQVFEALVPALPIAGVDGTLKKRMLHTPAQGRVWAKTGSVSGVSSLAGYARTADGRLLAFAILNHGVARQAHARAFQDKICLLMCE